MYLKAQGMELVFFVEDVLWTRRRQKQIGWSMRRNNEVLRAKIFCRTSGHSDGILTKLSKLLTIFHQVGCARHRTQPNYFLISSNSGTVFLAGPMGKFEDKNFSKGSWRY